MEHLSNSSKETLKDFPTEVFNQDQRIHGGVILYAAVAIYSCYALFAICDSYFIPALHILIKRLGLSNDVAGATIMAMASAAPGFFISVIGIFVIHNDLGLGNILGSCVFNVYAVIGVCGLVIKQEIHMEWWPVTRDCAYYVISLILLTVTLADKKMYWYEALILMIAYVFYIIVLKYSEQLKCCIQSALEYLRLYETMCILKEHKMEATMESKNSNEKENQLAVIVIKEEQIKTPIDVRVENSSITTTTTTTTTTAPTNQSKEKNEKLFDGATKIIFPDCHNKISDLKKDELSKLAIPSSLLGKFIWLITLPIEILYCLTVPDCKSKKWEKFYLMTFLISIAYIGSITYLVSWMVTVIGVTFAISDTIMGYTALSIGTSMPDLFCSLAVARQGFGNMALANGIGSNIMDILVNLSLPWFVKCILPGSIGYSSVTDKNVTYIITVMILSVFPIYGVLLHHHFNLNRKVAFISLGLYVIFVTLSVVLSIL